MHTFRSSEEQPISDAKLKIIHFFDLFVLAVFIISLALSYFSRTSEEKDLIVNSLWSDLTHFVNEPVSLFSLGLFIFILYLIFITVKNIIVDNYSEIDYIIIIKKGIYYVFKNVC
jgi:hypothetical protein